MTSGSSAYRRPLSQELQSVYLGISQSFTDQLSAVFNATFDFGQHKLDEARYPEGTQTDFDEQTVLFALVLRYQIKAAALPEPLAE